jgi:hypothetical protein
VDFCHGPKAALWRYRYSQEEGMLGKRFDADGEYYDNIFFTQERILGAIVLAHMEIEIASQNADIYHIKGSMAKQARSIGATTIMNFRYTQRKHKWWEYIFSLKWHPESWCAQGDAVRL